MAKHARPHKHGSDPENLPGGAPQDAPSSAPPEELTKNAAAVLLGRLGGKKGGPARARKLTPQQRSAIARKAALTRWARRRA